MPTSNAKVVRLIVRPSQAANLSFDVDGILGEMNVKLGSPVTVFNFVAFYANLGLTVTGSPGRLQYDSQGIYSDAKVQASLLFALRAEPAKAGLDTAVAARENACYQKYGNQAAIIAQMRQSYSPSVPLSKPAFLVALQATSTTQHNNLLAAYTADGRLGVVKTTSSLGSVNTSTSGSSNTSSKNIVEGGSSASGKQWQEPGVSPAVSTSESSSTAYQSFQAVETSPENITWVPTGYPFQITSGSVTTTSSAATVVSNGTGSNSSNNTGTAQTTTTGNSQQLQSTTNTDYGYRCPSQENDAQYQRAQISLIDEQFAQFMYGQNLPFLETVFKNELLAIDLGVKRLQVAYLNTILMSPIEGVVTGLYKNVGDRVKAGEPVIRVENNATEVLLVGTLIYRGLVSIGSTVTVTTSQFDSSNQATIVGSVVAARGDKFEDDQWDVVVLCNAKEGSGSLVWPNDYHFDYDDTTITIS